MKMITEKKSTPTYIIFGIYFSINMDIMLAWLKCCMYSGTSDKIHNTLPLDHQARIQTTFWTQHKHIATVWKLLLYFVTNNGLF